MAINPETQFVGKITASSVDYPYGEARDITTPGDGTGTPWLAVLLNDLFGLQQALLKAAGTVPSGSPDKVAASEYLEAIVELASGRAFLYDDSGVADAYVLDVRTDQQAPGSLFEGQLLRFVPANTNTGASTANPFGEGVEDIKLIGGIDDPIAGQIIAGSETDLIYRTSPGVHLELALSPTQAVLTNSSNNILASHKNLIITENTGTPLSEVDIDADNVWIEDVAEVTFKANSVNLTVDITASGVNGLDTGSETSSAWYYLWVIYNGSTVAGLLSLSKTAPTLPSGYTFKGLVGVVRNDGSSNFLGFRQVGAHARLDVTIQDVNDASSGTAANLATLTVPPSMMARGVSQLNSTGSRMLVTATTQTDTAPSSTLFDLLVGANATVQSHQHTLEVDSSSQIRYRTDVSADVEFYTFGWSFE